MIRNPYRELEKAIGYRFRRRHRLEQALTHPSFRYESAETVPDNQRLEFLGDAALGLVAAAFLYKAHPDLEEGELTQLRSRIASTRALSEIAASADLGRHLRLGRGESRTGGHVRASNLSDALEAVLGAAYVDGGLRAVERIFRRLFVPRLERLAHPREDNPKGILQEWAQARGLGNPRYRVARQEGPPHAPTYTVEVLVGDAARGDGTGANKRDAESAAAADALRRVASADDDL